MVGTDTTRAGVTLSENQQHAAEELREIIRRAAVARTPGGNWLAGLAVGLVVGARWGTVGRDCLIPLLRALYPKLDEYELAATAYDIEQTLGADPPLLDLTYTFGGEAR